MVAGMRLVSNNSLGLCWGYLLSIPWIASRLFQRPAAHGSESQALREKQRSNPFRPAAMESLVMSAGLGEPHHTSISTVKIP